MLISDIIWWNRENGRVLIIQIIMMIHNQDGVPLVFFPLIFLANQDDLNEKCIAAISQ